MTNSSDPHRGQPVLTLGPAPKDARLTMIMAHGRGASAEDMLGLAAEFHTADVAFLAPQAAGRTWYPYSFLSPIHDNEPGISSGLGVIAGLVDGLVAQQVPHARIALIGFSQGACLTLEFAARHPRALRRGDRPQRRPDRTARHAARLSRRLRRGAGLPGLQRHRSRTFRWPGFRSPRTCSAGWGRRSTSGSIRGWGTR